MIVFLNPRSAGGAAERRWERVRPRLEAGPLRAGYELVTDPAELRRRLGHGDEGATAGGLVVAAGGDGTVHLVAELLMALPEAERRGWFLGGIGLGSSNDFHRPRAARRGHLPPLRIDVGRARREPVGRVAWIDEGNHVRGSWFLLNASVGVVAAGNHLFNHGDAAGRFLKRRWTAGAIGYAAIRAVLRGGDVGARILVDGAPWAGRLTNLHVLLSPFVSGGLRYRFAVPSERAFSVAICEALGTVDRVRVLAALAGGRFEGRRGTLVRTAQHVEVEMEPSAPVPLELDGEVFLARSIRCEHVAGALNVCA